MDKKLQRLETYAFSALVAFLAGSQPNSCFKDAWEALMRLPQWFRHGKYVEGWIVIELADAILVIEHGYCLLPDGRVVDPAIVLLVGPEQPVLYVPGMEYTWEETLAFEGEWLPRVWETSSGRRDGMQHPAYKAAYETALEVATHLSTASHPHKNEPFTRHRQSRKGNQIHVRSSTSFHPLHERFDRKGDNTHGKRRPNDCSGSAER